MNESRPAGVLSIDHVHIYVTDIHQAAHFYASHLGMRVAGPASRFDGHSVSICLERRGIKIVLTAPAGENGRVAQHIQIHGEGVNDVALRVTNVEELFDRAIRNGARAVADPEVRTTIYGPRRTAVVGVLGDLVHTLLEYESTGSLVPAQSFITTEEERETALESIDHVAVAMNPGEVERWAAFYIAAFDFHESHAESVNTEFSSMKSKVVQSPNGCVRFPMMEPAAGRRKSQIQSYLDCHKGPGVQHLAFLSRDIVQSVSSMTEAGLQFLPTPLPYYDTLQARVGEVADLRTLARLGILMDRDPTGVLLQVFSKPVGPIPTMFFEVVERRGAQGFGSGNIKALFEAVERLNAQEASC